MRTRSHPLVPFLLLSALAAALPVEAAAAPVELELQRGDLQLVDRGAGGDALDTKLLGRQLAFGAGAALVAAPVGLAVGTFVGSISSNIVLAALPALLLYAALPPLAVTWAAWRAGRAPGARFWPAFWATLGTQVAVIAAGVFAGVSTRYLPGAALFTLAEAIVLPIAAVGTMHLTAAPPEARPVARVESQPARLVLAAGAF